MLPESSLETSIGNSKTTKSEPGGPVRYPTHTHKEAASLVSRVEQQTFSLVLRQTVTGKAIGRAARVPGIPCG